MLLKNGIGEPKAPFFDFEKTFYRYLILKKLLSLFDFYKIFGGGIVESNIILLFRSIESHKDTPG
jgi:hypothetical protein